MKNLRTMFLTIRGADFLCVPCMTIDGKSRYKLCWVKKVTDNYHNLSVEYELIRYAKTISEAKEKSKEVFGIFI